MKKDELFTSHELRAVARFTAIAKIKEHLERGVPLAKALEWAALCPFDGGDGRPRRFSVRTLEGWWYDWQKHGLDGLRPRSRGDQGVPRRISGEQQRWILEQIEAHPGVKFKILYRKWRSEGRPLPALNTIYRFLRMRGLDAGTRALLSQRPPGGPTKAFEAPFVNDLWMTDFSPGPFLRAAGSKKALPTHLCLIIDDHSRLVPHGAYGGAADTAAFHQVLKQAVARRGLPAKLYTDQGGPFINDHTRVVCANLGVRLLHARPYHSWSKGKVERLFRTVQEGFEASLRLPGEHVETLEELNARFSRWLQTHYHQRVHSSTGQTPAERFGSQRGRIRLLDPEADLEALFYHRVQRRVRKDGTVRLHNRLFEVDLALRQMQVQLRYDPAGMKTVEVWRQGRRFENAVPADLHLNSQIQRRHE